MVDFNRNKTPRKTWFYHSARRNRCIIVHAEFPEKLAGKY